MASLGKNRETTNSRRALLRAIAMVGGSATLGQIIVFAFSPVITRLFSPEVFGVQGIFIAALSIVWPLTALRYPMAIPLAVDDDEVSDLVFGSLVISVTIGCILFFATLVYIEFHPETFGHVDAIFLASFFCLAVCLICVQDLFEFNSLRNQKYRAIGIASIFQALSVNILKTVGGLFSPTAYPLIIASSAAYGIQALVNAVLSRGALIPSTLPPVGRVKRTLIKYRGFALFRAPAEVATAATLAFPVIALSMMFDTRTAGFYALARSVVSLPIYLVGGVVGNVIFAQMSAMLRAGDGIFRFVVGVFLIHLLLPALGAGIVFIFLPKVFGFVFGDDWSVAGTYAQWMLVWVVLMIASIPCERAIAAVGRQGVHLFMNWTTFFGSAIAIVVGGNYFDTPNNAIVFHSSVLGIMYILQISIYLRTVLKSRAR